MALVNGFQSAYKPIRSTETALVRAHSDIMRAMDGGKVGVLVMLDLSAAFDTVDHDLLLDRLREVGVRGRALSWFMSYLSDRHHGVVAEGERSSQTQLGCGVPQGCLVPGVILSLYIY